MEVAIKPSKGELFAFIWLKVDKGIKICKKFKSSVQDRAERIATNVHLLQFFCNTFIFLCFCV